MIDLLQSHLVILPSNLCSEMYEARRWNEDPRFQAPMTTLPNGTRVFIGDYVSSLHCFGRLKKLVVEVCIFIELFWKHLWMRHVYNFYSGTPKCGPPEMRTPSLSGHSL